MTALVTVFRPTPLPGDRMTYVKQVEGVDTRLTLLWFLETDPRECWQRHFTGLDEQVTESGLGRWNWWRRSFPRCRGRIAMWTGSAEDQGGVRGS